MARLKAPQRREQLLAVATKLFARMGYEATTTAAIADAAGVTEPILYRHFVGKAELFVAIVQNVSEETIAHWKKLIEGTNDPAEQIRRIAAAFPKHVAELSDAYHVLHGALATTQDRKVVAVIKEHYAQIESFFCDILRAGQRSGSIKPDIDPRLPAWQIINLGIGYAMTSLRVPTLYKGLDPTQIIELVLVCLRR